MYGFIQHSKIALGSCACAKLLHSNFTSELRLQQKIFLSWKLIATTSTKIQFSPCFFVRYLVPNNFPSKIPTPHTLSIFFVRRFYLIIFLVSCTFGIFFLKLFWHTSRKYCFCDWGRDFAKITWTFYLNSAEKYFLNFSLDVFKDLIHWTK